MPLNFPRSIFSVGTYFEVRIEAVNRYICWRTYLLCELIVQRVLLSVSNDIQLRYTPYGQTYKLPMSQAYDDLFVRPQLILVQIALSLRASSLKNQVDGLGTAWLFVRG